ncbi:MAG: YjbQ family protein [Nanoarchaeota archaeon]|nr:YjbQ family protein [DPANN group archaeon]MBL7116833.1 YjbQ family protein [Nanoarchaeota archaeon]
MTYKAVTKKLSLKTKKRLHFINITKKVEEVIHESGITTGSVVVQTHHTTCSVWVNEDEKNLIGHEELDYEHDLKRILDRFAHPDEEYGHNDIKDARNPEGKRDTHLCEPDENGICHECVNGHAHAQAMILQHSITMVINKGKLVKGKWQQIMACELDQSRNREITVLVQGTTEE